MFNTRPLAVEAPGTGCDDFEIYRPEGMEGSGTRMPLNCLAAGVTNEEDARFSLISMSHGRTIVG